MTTARSRACILGAVILAALVIAVPAGRRPFWSSDEARYALLAQDILEHGHWFVAELRGQPYLNKPQLFFWAVAGVSLPFGHVSEGSAVIPALISSLVEVIGVIAVGRLLWGWRAGALAGLVLVTTPFHFEMSHQVLPDVMLNAWLVWALYWLLRAERAEWRLGPLLAFYGCLIGGLLSKGPEALAACAAAGAVVALVDGPAALGRLRPLLGAGLMLSVAAIVWLGPYHVASAGRFGDRVLLGHYLSWYLVASHSSRLKALATPVVMFLPWTLFLAAAATRWRQSPDTGRRRIIIWTATLWVLVAVSGNGRARYLLPVFPGLALLTAEFLAASVAGRAKRAVGLASITAAAFAILVAVVVALGLERLAMSPDHPYVPDARWEQTAIVVLALAAGAVLLLGARRGAVGAGAVGLALALAGMMVIEGVTYPARYTRAFDLRPLASAVDAHVPPMGVVLGHPDVRLTYDFYVRRSLVELSDPEDVRRRLASAPPDAIIISADRWRALSSPEADAWGVLASAMLGGHRILVLGRGAL